MSYRYKQLLVTTKPRTETGSTLLCFLLIQPSANLLERLYAGHVSWYWPQSIIVTASKWSFMSTATTQPPSGTATQCHKTARCKLPSHTRPNRSPSATDSRHSNPKDIRRDPHLSLNTEVTNVTLHNREVQVTVTNSGQEVIHWLEQQEGVTAFGVDVEWRPNFAKGEDNPVALLQIGAGEKCLLVQLLYIDYIPRVSDATLSTPRILSCHCPPVHAPLLGWGEGSNIVYECLGVALGGVGMQS